MHNKRWLEESTDASPSTLEEENGTAAAAARQVRNDNHNTTPTMDTCFHNDDRVFEQLREV
jgi:hypothetical protein